MKSPGASHSGAPRFRGALGWVLLTPFAVLAQNANTVEEVVVTGTKRDATLQDTDVSMTVLDEDAIQQARLRDVRRIDDLVPNVAFNEKGQLGGMFVTIRGVESNPFIINRAAVYIDGIPFRELSNAVLNQVESIEVLRGPQATLYGANSESGVIVVRTKAPGDESQAQLRLTATDFSSGSGLETDGFLTGPILGDTLSGSLSFVASKEDAFTRTLTSSIGEPGEIREGFLQGRIRWTPNDRLTLSALAYYLQTDAPGMFSYEYLPKDLGLYNATYASMFNDGRRADKFTSLNDAPKHHDEHETVLGASLTYLLDSGKIDAAASYRRERSDSRGLDFDLTASPIVAGAEKDGDEFWNAELRYSSPSGEMFEYMFGVAVYDEFKSNTKGSFLGAGNLRSYAYAPWQEAEGRDYSAFGTATYAVPSLPKLKVSAGLRYDHAERSTLQREGTLDLGFGSVIAYPNADLSADFEVVLPRIALRYEASDDLTWYGSMAQGWVPGGFNLAAVQAGFTDPNILLYDKETLWSRELGFHWRRPGLRTSGAVFYITSDNWQDIQVASDANGRPVSSDFISSDASIRSRGFELEGQWDVTAELSLIAHVGYVDAKYLDLQVDDATNARGKRVQFVPEYDSLLAMRYAWPSGYYVRAEATGTGEMSLEARGRAVQPAVAMFGLQVGLERQRYSVRLFGENLSNERRMSGLAVENLAFGTDGNFYGPLDAPRIVGIEMEAKF
ncbi:TonB-dependent receptor [Steroidobacter sp. S1-65]|uniref:TonB-dependent receptor n=1 Tax=Steroidobacter gossypii TaxID=2805490 RepID=A0ABS1WY89_9GAMM|nr:TonB-dependent receptor [Steroidobacter gossypii]MBM0105897.1 TonB-dependent receptor [Steroidobacter gossypii]